MQLRILEARSLEELFEKALTFDPDEPVWTVRADLGLVIPLELTGVDVEAFARAKVHVVQETRDEPRSWVTRPLRGGEHPFVHYDSLIQRLERSTSARLELEIESPGGPSFRGSAPLAEPHGVHPTVSIAVEEETRAFGLVVDEQGQALGWARVWLLPVAPAEPLDEQALGRRTSSANDRGAFSFREIEPGPQLLRVNADGRASTARRVLLHPGANDLGTIVLPIAGIVPPGDLENHAIEVSAADRELRLLALGDDGLPFARFNLSCRVDGRWHSGWLLAEGNVPLQAERYLVSSRGHRARFVAPHDFVPTPDGEARVARVQLEPGWSASLVFLDADAAPMDGEIDPHVAPPLDGVRVMVDGRQVALSDADGLALVSLESAPSELTFELAGHHLLAIDEEHGLRFVWLVRE